MCSGSSEVSGIRLLLVTSLWVAGLAGCGAPPVTVPGCTPVDFPAGVTRAALEGPEDPGEAARAFVTDPQVRRAALEASVAVADTDYGALRLAHYSLLGDCLDDAENDWDARPVYLPTEVRPLRVRTRADEVPEPSASGPVGDLESLDTLEDWVALGREAFTRYPVSVDAGLRVLRDAEQARAFGLRVGPDQVAEGLVESRVASGSFAVAITCATCHASPQADGSLLHGPANPNIDYGVITGDAWPLATMDVTPDEMDNPVRPSDLRAYALQERIHHAGNLANGRIARMVRIETLITGQLAYAARPDRRIIAALVLYLDSLADALPRPDWEHPGAGLFETACSSCHAGVAMTGPPVRVGALGTDPAATVGSSRATGGYRSPSLLGVADRVRVLHDASASGLTGLLRLTESEHQGHAYGSELGEEERWAIAEFLGVERP